MSDWPPFTVALNDQRTEATIDFASKQIRVTATQLETAIAYLGMIRGQMTPEVPVQTPTQSLPISHYVFSEASEGGTPTEKGATLFVRAPYFGWLATFLPANYCKGLILWLQGEIPASSIGQSLH